MDFTTIGKIGSFVKQKNLLFAANYKIKTGQRIVDANGNLSFSKASMFDQINQAQKKSQSELDKARIASIKQKLMSGKKLSNEEMSYLREKDEKLYKKAKHADEAREELKAALKSAKTKQEARQAVTQAMIKASAEASAEIAAFKAGMAGGGGANVAGGDMNLGGDVNIGELPSFDANVAGAENPAMLETNSEIAAENLDANSNVENITAENINAENENSVAQSENQNSPLNNDDDDKTTADDILEKFIMTIRALEDEWAQFSKSDKYKNLPESISDEARIIEAPDFKTLQAILAYRKSMSYRGAV